MSTLDEIRHARAYLLRVAEPPAPALVTFIQQHGPVTAAALIREGNCPPSVADVTAARRKDVCVQEDFTVAERLGARLVIPEDDEWPADAMRSLSDAMDRGVARVAPPVALWVRGPAPLNEAVATSVTIVGARAASDYGEHHSADFAYGLASRGITIASGAAYGIDGAAHRGTLAVDGTTLAVLGSGLDTDYPAGHVNLLERIARTGAVISEYGLTIPPARHRFLTRNRLLAALTTGTLVIEAGRRSGAINTARTAARLGRAVMAVPGPVGSAMSVGCHQLIRAGEADLVTSVAHVIEQLHSSPETPHSPASPDPR